MSLIWVSTTLKNRGNPPIFDPSNGNLYPYVTRKYLDLPIDVPKFHPSHPFKKHPNFNDAPVTRCGRWRSHGSRACKTGISPTKMWIYITIKNWLYNGRWWGYTSADPWTEKAGWWKRIQQKENQVAWVLVPQPTCYASVACYSWDLQPWKRTRISTTNDGNGFDTLLLLDSKTSSSRL